MLQLGALIRHQRRAISVQNRAEFPAYWSGRASVRTHVCAWMPVLHSPALLVRVYISHVHVGPTPLRTMLAPPDRAQGPLALSSLLTYIATYATTDLLLQHPDEHLQHTSETAENTCNIRLKHLQNTRKNLKTCV
jgi:hypothetical protein